MNATPTSFKLTSPDFSEGTHLALEHEFNGFDGRGQNVSPALNWSGAPAGTRSFAVTVYDPDAPTGSGWWHYVLLNIPASCSSLARGAGTNPDALPRGVTSVRNDYGIHTFGGPCPPKGDRPHRYEFTVHALSVERIDLPEGATAALAGFMLHANRLAAAKVTAVYGR